MSNYYVRCRMGWDCNHPCAHVDPHPWELIPLLDTDGEDTCRRCPCTDEHPCPALGGASTCCVPVEDD